MKPFTNLNDFLSSFPTLPSFYSLSEDLIIDDKEKIKYRFLIDKIIEKSPSEYEVVIVQI